MKLHIIAALFLLTAAGGCRLGSTSSDPYPVPERHRPKVVMGRDYWTLLFAYMCSDPACKTDGGATPRWAKNPAIANRAVFRDCGLVYRGDVRPPDPAKGKATCRTLKECFATNGRWDQVEANAKPDKPMFLNPGCKRGKTVHIGEIDLDYADYEAWKARHPNYVATYAASEWDCDVQFMLWTSTWTNGWRHGKEKMDELMAFLGKPPKDRYERAALQKKSLERRVALNYGDWRHAGAMRCGISLDHCAAAWGIAHLQLETTNTSRHPEEIRWNVMPMFTRGAARQFGLTWEWYVAQFFNGYAKDGTWMNDSVCDYLWTSDGKPHPERGISPSLLRRVYYYAYLSGANFVRPESWPSSDVDREGNLTDRGHAFCDYHDFTAAHPNRGTPYTPVAVLVPMEQGYPACGGRSWRQYPYEPADQTVDAVFFTIDPGRMRNDPEHPSREGCLLNSKFAMMYDVVAPDAPQKPEELLAVLKSYRAVIRTGHYRDTSFKKTLARYEREGGRVIAIDAKSLPPVDKKTATEIMTGYRTFPGVEKILAGLQADYFPFKVDGDVMYGANRIDSTRWWLYAFNNRGITKYADQLAETDPTAVSQITVSPNGLVGAARRAARPTVTELFSGKKIPVSGDGTFSYAIAPGDLAIFEIE